MSLLDTIHSPRDLKKVPREDLTELAREIRQQIVDVVSRTGGHLASSLGVVELSIALHYVFDVPQDKIIWDVGHQAYAHKLLTGRKDRFHTLRQHGGLSGFPKITESPCDAFSTGHSSTSISAALGIATAKNLKSDHSRIIAVIGDGSMTAGLAFEGLNQAGDSKKDMIVILNDNDLSIAPNVGALSSLLSRTFSAKYLQDLKRTFGDFLLSLPKVGADAYQLAKRAEESFKAFVTPGMLFEGFNFDYYGPIKGHRLNQLIDILNNIKKLEGPVLLHVLTQKGKGYAPAEANPVYFHGVGSFEPGTGTKLSDHKNTPTYTEVFGHTLVELAQADDKIIAVTAAMPEGTGLAPFAKQFPHRFFDVGIAEQHGVTFAAGLAIEGMKPVVAIYSTFLQRAYDQIVHDVCLESLPVIFAVDRGGLVGEDGPTHHGLFDLSYLRSLPNMTVMAPKDENELRRMMKTAVLHPGPIAFRYPRGCGPGAPLTDPCEPLAMGKGELLKEGRDVLILAIGSTVADALRAADLLAAKNIDAAVVNSRFVKPLDAELICGLAEKIPYVLTVEENVLQGGFGSAVLEALADGGIRDVSVRRIGIDDRFVEHGAASILRTRCGLDAEGIADAALTLIRR